MTVRRRAASERVAVSGNAAVRNENISGNSVFQEREFNDLNKLRETQLRTRRILESEFREFRGTTMQL